MADAEERPVLNGLVALVTVALVVGLLAGLAALLGSRVLGIDGTTEAGSGEPAQGDTLFLPDPVPTEADGNPLVTLVPSQDEEATGPTKEPAKPSESEPETEISLSAGADSVGSGEQLYLTGTYPEGEGVVLDIENRIGGGAWQEFPLDVNVSNEEFTTYVETFRSGRIEWRVRDVASRITSNVVVVQHG